MIPFSIFVASLLSAPAKAPVDFDTQIIPVLTKAGCNAGSCHGAASGRGGFRLSLWGSDPGADHLTISRELEGRRINLAKPRESLFLLKPLRDLPHKGGQRFSEESESAKLILRWLQEGARHTQRRKLIRFEVIPASSQVSKLHQQAQLKAVAHFSDQSKVDVTQWAVFKSSDPEAIEVSKQGTVTIHRRGQHVILVRYLDQVVPVRLTLPLQERALDLSKAPRHLHRGRIPR